MSQEPKVTRLDKLTKLIAVYDQFHTRLALLDDRTAKLLAENWARTRQRYIQPESTSRSALATGMVQGLREMPMILDDMVPDAKSTAVAALSAAIAAHYPEFLEKDNERLNAIKERGVIRGQREYYLLRYHIDVLEGKVSCEEELRKCQEMIDRFEASRG